MSVHDEDVPWRQRAAALAQALADAGDLNDPSWREVISRVPRHVFVPHFARTRATRKGTRYDLVTGADPAQREEWLNGVYSDTTLLTQVDGQAVEELFATGSGYGRHSSSSTAPRLMVWMLESLGLTDGDDVLEIGTGTGYNAALLAERLGEEHVTTVDIDGHLVQSAQRRLAQGGYHPTLVTGDGRLGHHEHAPYDHVISTCGLPYVPPAWIAQTRPGGRILTNVTGLIGGAVLLADVHEDGRATGRFLPRWAGFMPSRHADSPLAPYAREYTTGQTALDPAVLDDHAFAFLTQLHLPGARRYAATRDDGRELFGLRTADGSWAEVYAPDDAGHRYLEQGGPHRLWDAVEEANRVWLAHRQPDWTRFTFAAEPGSQVVALREGNGSEAGAWELPVEALPDG
ncbi:ATP-grasp peptide maturase system methyltransferase [Streptomyces synnematoformans]|uniref:Protein-L-isoaspartate O-methyltransferase n=1 Tax=Streptomyces synnematoformans TaxID=415721 RepID=A0ABP5J5S4_9ACTN